MSDTDTDTDTENENESIIYPFDTFIFNESDYIIDLHEDLKNRVPYFFRNTSVYLYDFILNHIFDKKNTQHNFYVNDYFINEYHNEIQVTLDTVNNYLLNRKKSLKCCSIKLIDWQNFCYENFT